MKKQTLIKLLVIAIVLTAGICALISHSQNKALKEYEAQQNLKPEIEIPDTGIIRYSENIPDDKPMVAMFYVDWCTYCRRFMPKFGEISKKYNDKYNFVVVNCDYPENKKLAEDFHIMGFPSLFIIDKKLNHSFSMNLAGTIENKIMFEELDNYITFREQFIK